MLSAREKLALLQGKSSLKQLIAACPSIWKETGTEINERLAGLANGSKTGAPGEAAGSALNTYIKELNAKAETWKTPLAASKYNLGLVERAFGDLIKARMAWLALQNYYLAALGGQSKGIIRFNWWNGTLLQHLLFRRGFERKPVSMFWYHLVWPLISQKKILMRLVYRKGIYCFYSARLVKALARMAREISPDHPVLEIAAGDGTLSRFLSAAGCPCLATDDLSWESSAKAVKDLAPGSVLALDAASAIAQHKPKVVVCSWPPAGNHFEQKVLAAPHTILYVVIGSRHQFASGNWNDYLRYAQPVQDSNPPDSRAFTMELSESLSAAMLPRELDNAVLIFRRRT